MINAELAIAAHVLILKDDVERIVTHACQLEERVKRLEERAANPPAADPNAFRPEDYTAAELDRIFRRRRPAARPATRADYED